MKYFCLAVLLNLFSCKKELDYEQVFGYDARFKSLIINTNSIGTISELTDYFCENGYQNDYYNALLPYDFNKSEINNGSELYIPFLPEPSCDPVSIYSQTGIHFYLNQLGIWEFNNEELNFNKIDSLLSLNILNDGYYPQYAENPQKAIFHFHLYKDQPLKRVEGIFRAFSKSYVKFLNTQADKNYQLDSLKDKYPLIIFLHASISDSTELVDMEDAEFYQMTKCYEYSFIDLIKDILFSLKPSFKSDSNH